MSGFTETQVALDSKLATLEGLPPVAWDNDAYTPAEGTTYVRPSNLPAGHTAIGISNDDSIRGAGIYQVDVLAPVGAGAGAALNLADRISSLFWRGQRLQSGNSTVTVGVPTQDPSISGGAWFMVSVLIPYDTIFRS